MERRFKVTVNGREYDVTVEDLTPTSSSILPQPGDMKVPAPQPAPAPVAPSGERQRADSDPALLTSPLAGVVETIDIVDGEQVEVGQRVLVIEAMKMRTSVVAHRSGQVSELNVHVGQAVDAGQALMSIG